MKKENKYGKLIRLINATGNKELIESFHEFEAEICGKIQTLAENSQRIIDKTNKLLNR